MSARHRWRAGVRAALMAALLLASGCATLAKWQQERHVAQVQREQNQEAVDRNSESKADITARQAQTQHDARLRQLQGALVARGDPDSLAAAALFEGTRSGFGSQASLDLASRAVAGAPQRADLLFILMQLCESAATCDAQPVEARLQQLDPDNGISWTYQLVRAAEANNGPAWQRARDGLAHTTRVDRYWTAIVSHLAAAAAGKAGFDTTSAAIELLGIEAAFTPAFEPVSRACSVQDVQQADVLAQCRRIAAAFRNADTSLIEAYGTSLALGLWPEGSAEGRQIAVERRGLRYRVALMTRNTQKVNSPQAQHLYAMLIGRYPTEQAAYHALFIALGLVPDPPANWTEHAAGG